MSGFSRGAQELQSGKARRLTGPPREAARGIAYAIGNPAETYRPVNGTDRIAPEGPAISAIAGPVSLRPAPLPTSHQIFRGAREKPDHASYFRKISSQYPCAFRINSTTSRTAPLPPGATVT